MSSTGLKRSFQFIRKDFPRSLRRMTWLTEETLKGWWTGCWLCLKTPNIGF